MKKMLFVFIVFLLGIYAVQAQAKTPRFKVIALYENGGHHIEYSKAAKVWLDRLAADSGFSIDYIQNTDRLDAAFLAGYQLFIQLDFPPYASKDAAEEAFQHYITVGQGGWVRFLPGDLLGEFGRF